MRRSASGHRLAILAALLTAGCSHYEAPDLVTLAPDEVARHPAIGCWQFPAMRANAFLAGDTRIRFDTVALTSHSASERRLVVEATADTALPEIEVAHWGALRATSAVYLVWGNGFGGFAVEAVVRGDSLFGRGRNFTDFPTASIRRRVTAVRVPCVPQPSMLVVGFLDAGYPLPSGEGSPGERFVVSGADARCASPLDSATTDSAGHFRVEVPGAVRTQWTLCIAVAPGLEPNYPVYRYSGRGTDSLRLYCRGHGPGSLPICQYSSWSGPFRWRRGETLDSLP